MDTMQISVGHGNLGPIDTSKTQIPNLWIGDHHGGRRRGEKIL